MLFYQTQKRTEKREEEKKCKNKIFTAINFNTEENFNSRNIYFTISQELKWNFFSMLSHFSFIANRHCARDFS